jgi:hypothetical protein
MDSTRSQSTRRSALLLLLAVCLLAAACRSPDHDDHLPRPTHSAVLVDEQLGIADSLSGGGHSGQVRVDVGRVLVVGLPGLHVVNQSSVQYLIGDARLKPATPTALTTSG